MEKSTFTREYRVMLELLHDYRTQAGITQTELAEQLGRTQSIVSKIERGELRLDMIQVRTICQLLGTDLVSFVNELEKRLAHKVGRKKKTR